MLFRNSDKESSETLHVLVYIINQRGVKWASLRRKTVAEKKFSVTIMSFHADKRHMCTAAYLDVLCSAFEVTMSVKEQVTLYSVEEHL